MTMRFVQPKPTHIWFTFSPHFIFDRISSNSFFKKWTPIPPHLQWNNREIDRAHSPYEIMSTRSKLTWVWCVKRVAAHLNWTKQAVDLEFTRAQNDGLSAHLAFGLGSLRIFAQFSWFGLDVISRSHVQVHEGGLLRKPPLKCAYVNSARNYIFMRDTSLRVDLRSARTYARCLWHCAGTYFARKNQTDTHAWVAQPVWGGSCIPTVKLPKNSLANRNSSINFEKPWKNCNFCQFFSILFGGLMWPITCVARAIPTVKTWFSGHLILSFLRNRPKSCKKC